MGLAKVENVYPIDLNFLGVPGAIASYLIPHNQGAVLIEAGPGSCLSSLLKALAYHGYRATDVTDVFLTHVHLDHAGAAGWLAQRGAVVHVHPLGAPHLLDPQKLLASAGRIYGDQMSSLWGDFLPVPEESIEVHEDGEIIPIGSLQFQALDTPGHADHHFAYQLDKTLFLGDVGGVRLQEPPYVSLPTPPPEFNLDAWRCSLQKLRSLNVDWIAPTHFGLYADPVVHWEAMEAALDHLEGFMQNVLPHEQDRVKVSQEWSEAEQDRLEKLGIFSSPGGYQAVNPAWMSTAGMLRYWRKLHQIEIK